MKADQILRRRDAPAAPPPRDGGPMAPHLEGQGLIGPAGAQHPGIEGLSHARHVSQFGCINKPEIAATKPPWLSYITPGTLSRPPETVFDAGMAQNGTDSSGDPAPTDKAGTDLARRLLMTRRLLDGNRARIADEFHVHHTTWQKWEEGKRDPNWRVMVKFCDKYQVTMDWLYRGDMSGLHEYWRAVLYRAYPELLQEQLVRPPTPAPGLEFKLDIPPPSEGSPLEPLPLPKQTRRRRKHSAAKS